MEILTLPLDQITPYDRNPRRNDHAVDAVAASIREFGFKVPLVIDSAGVIVTGHTRYKAARKLGLASVPCIRADDLTPEQIRAFRLADNKVGELADWDDDLLSLELGELSADFGALLTEMGFESPTDSGLDVEDVVEDDVPEPETVPPRVATGDLWRLGDHLLLCADAADPSNMAALFGDDRADFVFTDPPYGVAYAERNAQLNEHGKGNSGRCTHIITNDNIPARELKKILTICFTNLKNFCSEQCSYYVSSPQGGELGMMMMMMQDAGLPVRHLLIWVKNQATFSLGRLDYDYRHEPIMYTWGKRHNFYGGYGNTVIEEQSKAQLKKMSKAQLEELVWAYQNREDTSVIYHDKPIKSAEHPTMKPVKLVARFMFNSSREGDVVADIFGGSGTTMIAAEQLRRRARLMEIDPHYCDVILSRWEQFTGRAAEKVSLA